MLKTIIVGLGKMGQEHANWVKNTEGMQLSAICEKNEDRHKEISEKYKVKVYRDLQECIDDIKPDFAVIVTTNEVHEKLSVLALNNGVNVIVEKPMTMTFESAQRMVQAAEKNKKQLLVHQSSRWDREYLAIKNIIDAGKIGDVLVIQARVLLCDEFWPSWGIDGMANPWRVKAEYGGGMLYDWGPHLVDQVLQLIPEDPVSVYGMLQSGVWSKEVDDHFFAILRYKSNIMAQIEVSNNGRINSPRWYVIGKKGTIAVPGKSEPFWDEVVTNYIDQKGKKQIEKIKLVDVKESGLEGGFYEDLLPYLNGEIKNHVSMYDAAKVIKVLELIKKSSEENKVLKID